MVPQVIEQAVDGVAGQTTYRLNLRLGDQAENVYTIYGSPSAGPMSIPGAFQVATPFGANTGGVNPAFYASSPDSQYDSWLTVGLTEGDSGGAMSSIGIDWDSWTTDAGIETSDGALFWMAPTDGPTGEGDARAVTVAQITVPTGTAFTASVSTQGRSVGAGAQHAVPDWDVYGTTFTNSAAGGGDTGGGGGGDGTGGGAGDGTGGGGGGGGGGGTSASASTPSPSSTVPSASAWAAACPGLSSVGCAQSTAAARLVRRSVSPPCSAQRSPFCSSGTCRRRARVRVCVCVYQSCFGHSASHSHVPALQ